MTICGISLLDAFDLRKLTLKVAFNESGIIYGGLSFCSSDKTKWAEVCVSETASNNSSWSHYIWLDGTNFSVKKPLNVNSLLRVSFLKRSADLDLLCNLMCKRNKYWIL